MMIAFAKSGSDTEEGVEAGVEAVDGSLTDHRLPIERKAEA